MRVAALKNRFNHCMLLEEQKLELKISFRLCVYAIKSIESKAAGLCVVDIVNSSNDIGNRTELISSLLTTSDSFNWTYLQTFAFLC